MTVEVLAPLKKPKLILIDLDGTLVDSVPDLAFAVNGMMQQLSLQSYQEEKVRLWVGNGVEKLVKRALTDDMDIEPDPDLFARALPIFKEIYQANVADRSCLYPGILEGLEQLKQAAFLLACVTNKAATFTEPLLEKLKINHYFETIISGDTLPVKKPDPGPSSLDSLYA